MCNPPAPMACRHVANHYLVIVHIFKQAPLYTSCYLIYSFYFIFAAAASGIDFLSPHLSHHYRRVRRNKRGHFVHVTDRRDLTLIVPRSSL